MTIQTIFANIFGDSRRNAALKSFAKSEYRTDWEWAYNTLRAGQWPETKRR